MPGTGTAYATIGVRALPSTHIAHAATPAYAMPGTALGFAATRCAYHCPVPPYPSLVLVAGTAVPQLSTAQPVASGTAINAVCTAHPVAKAYRHTAHQYRTSYSERVGG
eukprot:2537010-Rhodomonas_salina.5